MDRLTVLVVTEACTTIRRVRSTPRQSVAQQTDPFTRTLRRHIHETFTIYRYRPSPVHCGQLAEPFRLVGGFQNPRRRRNTLPLVLLEVGQ